MAYKVIIDRGVTIAGVLFKHGSVINPTGQEAKVEIEAALKAGHLEDVKPRAAAPAATDKAASKPAAKEG